MTKLSWNDIENFTDNLAEKIKASGFTPDYIIGITTAGLIPLYFLARKLDNNRNILTITANSYNKDQQGELKILYLPEIDLSGKKVLLVDEISGTGNTLKQISNVLKDKYKVGELKTATLAVSKESFYYPDFYILEGSEDWVLFPWDKWEFPEHF